MTIPSDDQLDAAVARLEPRLFMTMGARTRRRRLTRILGGTALGAGLAAAGLVLGLALAPTLATPGSPAGRGGSAALPAPSTPTPHSSDGAVAGPAEHLGASDGAGSISCYSADGTLSARLQLAHPPADPSALCSSVTSTGTLATQATNLVTCAQPNGAITVFATPRGTSATTVCAARGGRVAGSNK